MNRLHDMNPLNNYNEIRCFQNQVKTKKEKGKKMRVNINWDTWQKIYE